MLALCAICEHPLKEGDLIVVMVTAHYHLLKSAVHYAIGTPEHADPETLCHRMCYDIETNGEEPYRE